VFETLETRHHYCMLKEDMQILVLQAFDKGLTLGQFLRSLPGSSKMSKEELQEYSKVYVEMRNSAVTE